MTPIRTPKTTGVYGAPVGHEDEVGGLPFYREKVTVGATVTTEVVSVWTFSPAERDFVARGANLVIGIFGREPIPPISVALRDGPAFSETKGDAEVKEGTAS